MDTATNPDELARRCADAMYARDEAAQALGIELVTIRAGYAEMCMEIKPWMGNGGRVCHGGLLFSLADTAMAFASNSRDSAYVAASTSMEFLSPGRLGETVTAIATETHRAGRTATYNVAIRDRAAQPIAQFLGRTYRVSGSVLAGPPPAS